jgi:hypothetical protein
LLRRLRDHSVECVVLAASAGDATPVATALTVAQLPATMATAAQLRDFTRRRAVFDAATLMRIARAISPSPRGPMIQTY